MSIFQGEISWNEIKKIVEEKIGGGLKVQGDGEVVRLEASEIAALDGTGDTYFGTVQINDIDGSDFTLSLIEADTTEVNTLFILSSATSVITINNVLFNKMVGGTNTDGRAYFTGYKITLA